MTEPLAADGQGRPVHAGELADLDAAGLGGLLAAGTVSAVEVVTAHLERIASREPYVHALLSVDNAAGLRAARRIDRARAAGDPLGPLAGIPLVLKDNIDQRGRRTSCASAAVPGRPAARDAVIVTRLRRASAIVLGRANLDEFAMGASTESSVYGPSRNPWDLGRTPGGSSGGSAAALAAREVPLSVGTDTGGSIREPAAQCGLVGVKPTWGSLPMRGIVPFAPSLDQPGPMARTVLDAALLHDALRDDAAGTLAAAVRTVQLAPQLRDLRVGVLVEHAGVRNAPGVLDRFAVALAGLEGLGAVASDVSCPALRHSLAAYYTDSSIECLPTLAPYAGGGLLGIEAQRRHAYGVRLVELPRYARTRHKASRARQRISLELRRALQSCDVLVSPTMPTTAFRLGERTTDPMAMYRTDFWSVAANLAGLPALTMPCGLSPEDQLPVGVELMVAAGAESLLYTVAGALETRLEPLRPAF